MAGDGAKVDSFQRHGLYYPFFHVRDDRWLKVSALYWPRVARLVPDWYLTTNDSETARAFSNADPGFLYRLSPGDAVEEAGARFAQALEVCGPELRNRPNPRPRQPAWGGVHVTHISPAAGGFDGAALGIAAYAGGPFQQSWNGPRGWWHGPHAVQAWLRMRLVT